MGANPGKRDGGLGVKVCSETGVRCVLEDGATAAGVHTGTCSICNA